MDVSPASTSSNAISATASPLSPLKRQGSATIPGGPSDGVNQASKRLRKLMSSDDEAGGAEEHEEPDVDTEEEEEEDATAPGDKKGKAKVDSPAGNDLEDIRAKLETQATCGICQDVFWRPVSVIPCLHCFCGSCLVGWFAKNNACPSCRAPATSTTDSYASNNLVDMYLALPRPKGEEIEARTQEEKDDLDKVYKPGQKIIAGRGGRRHDDFDEDDEGEFDDDDEFDDDMDDWGHDLQPAEPPPRFHQPCECCVAPNPHNYTCATPIPADEILLTHYVAGHKECMNCRRLVPIPNDEPDKFSKSCVVCKVTNCSAQFGCDVGTFNTKPFRDQRLGHIGNQIAGLIPTLFNGVASEHRVLQSFLTARNWNLSQLYEEMFVNQNMSGVWPGWMKEGLKVDANGDADDDVEEVKLVGADENVCQRCAVLVLEATLEKEWPRMLKEEAWIKDYIAPHVVNRADCWYGLSCRTATHNLAHATRLSHLCPNTKPNALPPLPDPFPPAGLRSRIRPHEPLPPFDPTSSTTIQIRDLNRDRIFPASAEIWIPIHNGAVVQKKVPGKLICNGFRFGGAGGMGGGVFQATVEERDEGLREVGAVQGAVVEVLMDNRGTRWVRSTEEGEKPAGVRPVVGGEGADGEELWHAIAWKDGVRVPGWTKDGLGGAVVGFAGKGWLVKEYDLLCFS